MKNSLSITNLLNALQIDRNSEAVKLCIEAERLRRRQQLIRAIEVAEAATQLARDNYNEIGITLLYLSCMRLASHIPKEKRQAIRDCERARRSLSLSRFNQVIACIIRAQIEVEQENPSLQSSLVCFQRAKRALLELTIEAKRDNRVSNLKIGEELYVSVVDKITDLSRGLTDVPEDEVTVAENPSTTVLQQVTTAKTTPKTSLSQYSIRLSIPTRIVWPPPEPTAGFEIVPSSERSAPDYFDTKHLSIDNQLYAIEPMLPVVEGGGVARLRTKQPYLIVPLLDNEFASFALVRRTSQPEFERQYVVIHDPPSQTAWIDEAESDGVRVHIIGAEREWTIQEGAQPTPVFLSEPWIVGIVEAVLTRMA